MNQETKLQWIDSIFLFSMVWSGGCTTDAEGRQKFNAFFNELASGGIPDGYKDVMTDMPIGLAVPLMPDDEGATVYDFVFNKTSCHWESWTERISKLDIPSGTQFSDIIVPTKDSARLRMDTHSTFPCVQTSTAKGSLSCIRFFAIVYSMLHNAGSV